MPPLSPAVRSALKAVEEEGLLKSQTNSSVLHNVAQLLEWICDNREQIIGLISFIFRVVNDVEQYLQLDGPQKQQLAYTLVLKVLQQRGFVAQSGLLSAIISSMVNSTIKAAVDIFHRHDRFQRHTLGLTRN